MKAKLVNESLSPYMSDINLNEGLKEVFSKYTGKLKASIKSLFDKLDSSKQAQLLSEIDQYKGLSYKQIKQQLAQDANVSVNEADEKRSLTDIISNIWGTTVFSTFVISATTMWADDKWDFLWKSALGKSIQENVTGAMVISLAAFVVWALCRLARESHDDTYGY